MINILIITFVIMNFSKSTNAYTLLWAIYDCSPKHNRLTYVCDELRSMGLDIIFNGDKTLVTIVTKRKYINLNSETNSLVGIICNITNEKLTLISDMPSPVLKINKSSFSKESKTNGCKIYEINDGTTIGIYWYDEKWIIRSINGFDVGNYTWNGNKTYKTIFNEVMSEYPSFSLELLNKNKCYTIGMKHPDFHPFAEGFNIPVKKAWFIDSIDTNYITKKFGIQPDISDIERIGIPLQLPMNGIIDIENISIDLDKSIENFIETGKVFYGVILKVPQGTLTIHSSLYKYISTIFYTGYDNIDIKENGYDRQSYILLKLFLKSSPEILSRFLTLFPQFIENISKYTCIVSEIYDLMAESNTLQTPINKNRRNILLINTCNALRTQHFKYSGYDDVKISSQINITSICIKSVCKLSTLYDLMHYSEPTITEDLSLDSLSLS
jgi:hypothetical protein